MRSWLLEGRIFGVGKESGYLSVIWLCSRECDQTLLME